jgi:putative nucleotidyltransferase with HDIG domain
MSDERPHFNIHAIAGKLALSREVVLKVLITLTLVLLLALLFPRGEAVPLEFKIGAIWAQKDMIAPFSFPVLRDEKEYARDVEEAKRKVYEVFERDSTATALASANLQAFFRRLTETLRLRVEARKSQRLQLLTAMDDSVRYVRATEALEIPFTEKEWDLLASASSAGQLTTMTSSVESTARDIHQRGFLDRPKSQLNQNEIAIRQGTLEEIVPVDRLYDRGEIVTLLEQRLVEEYGSENPLLGVAYKIGINFLAPNILFHGIATDQAIAAAVDAVPRTTGFVQENERIISKHERITQETRLKLESYRRALMDRGPASDAPGQFLGTLLHVILALSLFSMYLILFRKGIVGNNRQLALIAVIFLLIGFLAYLTRELDVEVPIEYLIPVATASMMLTIIFDSRVGFYGTVVMAFVVAGIRGNDYSVALAALVAGGLAVYSVRDMKNRTQIFRSLLFILLGYALVILALGLEHAESPEAMGEKLLFAAANAIVAPVLTYGLLIFLERVFRVTTDLTLIELAHFNHPLQRLLAEKAPGTYHHSMTMASLTEAGAAAVGGNEVLARVAAYFHDIGKVVKPTYFVENQRGPRNRHDKLSPRMSSLIITAHVKDGIALAREYNLPEEIIDFIPMHHGTTRIDYFFDKALRLAQSSTDETKIDEINEQDYRYPGPKPQTKETGIMMLADAIEASVRTVEDPTPQRLEGLIDELIKKRFEEGELDECPLTLKDLTKIKSAFLSILVGVYHTRVKYPEPAPKKKSRRPPQVPEQQPETRESETPESPDLSAPPEANP